MKLSRLILILAFVVSCSPTIGQEIPKGVKYKPASEEVNEKSKRSLAAAFTSTDTIPASFFADVTVVGPGLWKRLKPTADPVLAASKSVVLVIPGAKEITTEGRRLLTDDERKAFWQLVNKQFAKLKAGQVRKGTAEEISYYWATIPFDIEEPFWVIDTGNERFIAHFQVKDQQPKLFWIDLVVDLKSLGP